MDRDSCWLADEELAVFRAAGSRRRYPAGSTLFVEGDEPCDVLLIESGDVKLTTVAYSGRELVLEVLRAGALLGELSAVDGAHRSATAVALSAVQVTSVSVERFNGFLGDHPSATRALLEQTILRLRLADKRQLEYVSSDAIGRVCARLDELASRFGGSQMRLTQNELAQWCGLSREAVVKALRKLRDLGWITAEDGQIAVVDEAHIHARGAI